ncbi:tripartite tricarboxylate transporter substrate binding protein [Pseudogracilibacillus sp. SE30717A]|uniref:tripartite tricarboxylate transporter substrate binding protein n=1 Tax=Pseudogracilibacillus sp. SE30717A TaxID=3098293 RepID=UPI00300E2D25
MGKMKSFQLIMVAVVFTFILAACSSSDGNANEESGDAKKWPHKNTTLILPFDAGGSLDSMMRVIAKEMEKELDTSIKIDNRPGAATQVGTTQFLNEKDDGSVIFGGTQLYLSASILLQDADYDIDDFAMVNIEQFDPITITVHKNSPYESFEDLIEDAKANPGKISYSTVHGGPLHLTGVLLEEKLDTTFKPVFYDGGGEMRNALLGEHVDFMIGNALGDNAIADNARVLALASEEKMDLWPDAEPINDVLAKYEAEVPLVGSVRFLATHATFKEDHPELFEMLANAYEKVFESEEYQDYIKENNAEEVSAYRGPEESDELNQSLHDLLDEYKDKLE